MAGRVRREERAGNGTMTFAELLRSYNILRSEYDKSQHSEYDTEYLKLLISEDYDFINEIIAPYIISLYKLKKGEFNSCKLPKHIVLSALYPIAEGDIMNVLSHLLKFFRPDFSFSGSGFGGPVTNIKWISILVSNLRRVISELKPYPHAGPPLPIPPLLNVWWVPLSKTSKFTATSVPGRNMRPIESRPLTYEGTAGVNMRPVESRPLTYEGAAGVNMRPVESRPLTYEGAAGVNMGPAVNTSTPVATIPPPPSVDEDPQVGGMIKKLKKRKTHRRRRYNTKKY
jgi:hypothetical protein